MLPSLHRTATGLSSRVAHRLWVLTPSRWLITYLDAKRFPARYASVNAYCFFVGHGRSGHSIIGALLDAHPDAIVSDELDALRYVQAGFSRHQLFRLSELVAIDQARGHRRKDGRRGKTYSYFVPGGWQGRVRVARVVGDSRAGGSLKRLAANATLLDQLRGVLGDTKLRCIHIIRNPYDNIATMMIRTGRTFDSAFGEYFSRWTALLAVRRRFAPDELMVLRHEDVLADPKGSLTRLCSFVGIEAERVYLDSCASILYRSPSQSRRSVVFTSVQRALIQEHIDSIDELGGYSFDAE